MNKEKYVNVKEALDLLNKGSVVALPTETVYGLAGCISHNKALEKIFQIKKRPHFDPLIVHVFSFEQALPLVKLSLLEKKIFQILSQFFWPGPLTFILKASNEVPSIVNSGLSFVGLRSPRQDLTLDILKKSGPLAAPSANRFGKISPVTAYNVLEEFNNEVFVLDGGTCDVGIESTILSIKEETEGELELSVLRKGMIVQDMLEDCLKSHQIKYKFISEKLKTNSPGNFFNHYQPDTPFFIINKKLDPLWEDKIKEKLNISTSLQLEKLVLDENPQIAARHLYFKLRNLSKKKPHAIYLEEIDKKNNPYWEAILDRLIKASYKV